MFFRNLTLFRFPKTAATSYKENRDALDAHPLKPVGPLEMQSRGWVSPFGRGEDGMTHEIGHFALMTLGSEDKILPAAVVNEYLADKIAELTEERGKPPGGRERKRMRDEALTDLLPRAFSKPGRMSGYLDLKNGWAVMDTVSRKSAEGFLTVLRETLGSFPAVPPDAEESPSVL